MNPISRALRAYAADAREAFTVAPVEVALCLLAAATFSVQLRAGSDFPEEVWGRIAVWVLLCLAPILALTSLHLRGAIGRPARSAGTAVLALVAGFYAFRIFDPDHVAEIWRVMGLTAAGVSFLLLTPAVPPRVEGRFAHWHFAFGFLARAAGVLAYAAVLWAAFAGAVASIVNLFELNQPDYLYADLAGWLFGAAAPWILVGGIRRLLEESVRPRASAPLAVVRFGRFVYAPVVVVYLGILYAYMARVAVTFELPKNLVSPLVLAAGLLGMAGALLLEPLHADAEQRGLSLLVRWVPALLLPLLPFALTAILMRQGQYGWTEFRYLRLVGTIMLGMVAVLGTVWLARRRMPPLASVPGILSLGLLLASVGPWSAQAVSRRDQQRRLREMLADAGARLPLALPRPGEGGPRDSLRVTSEQHDVIRDAVQYLASAHGVESLEPILGPNARRYRSAWDIAGALPLRVTCTQRRTWTISAQLASRIPLRVSGGTLVELDGVQAPPLPPDTTDAPGFEPTVVAAERGARADTSAVYRASLEGNGLRVSGPGIEASADLGALVSAMAAGTRDPCNGPSPAPLAIAPDSAGIRLLSADGGAAGELIVTELRVEHTPRGARLERMNGMLVLP